MLSVATVALSAAASAQQAPDVSLPEVVVTAPSPVVKPRAAKKRLPATQQGQTQAPQAAQDYPEPQPPAQSASIENVSVSPTSLPGTVITSDDAFVAVTVATEREILAQQGATITDTLQHKPGISGTTFAPGANRPIVRGLDSYRVRTQENGIGTHDVAALSEDHAIPIDPYSADRVEVVRGPATLRYGSQAIGGVVAVENQRVPTYIPTNGATGAVYGGVSSENPMITTRRAASRRTPSSTAKAVRSAHR
jgi:iron complex outermembrane receptor protein